ncbi:hypothetical protein BLNAU_6039 [Blattamonas nauphoetae]|uniref:Uncharacterized protein n=1 Tax=Blattamonas nauphoetae TaxID=2049346 RepID=A0ABQ9Y5J8_9EUKA|nr:hypothetical protein BLNAU_6039 [Blattamonas nauphoetae]
MDFVLALPVCLSFTSALTFNVQDFKLPPSYSTLLDSDVERVVRDRELSQSEAKVLRSLRNEGYWDAIELLSLTPTDGNYRGRNVGASIEVLVSHGGNVQRRAYR